MLVLILTLRLHCNSVYVYITIKMLICSNLKTAMQVGLELAEKNKQTDIDKLI